MLRIKPVSHADWLHANVSKSDFVSELRSLAAIAWLKYLMWRVDITSATTNKAAEYQGCYKDKAGQGPQAELSDDPHVNSHLESEAESATSR